jgi:mannose-6-phosphate isomerase-like protein (cupin superfamily)
MFMSLPTIHRVVTGHDENGKAVVSSQGPLPTVVEIAAVPGMVFHEVWTTAGSPAPIDNGIDPTLMPLRLLPPKSGTRVRFVDFPPETPDVLVRASEKSKDAFTQISDLAALTVKADSPHPLMHRTETVDYGIVIEGEITLVLDGSEALLRPGSVVVQRGTNHAWANRSGRPCRMLFVLVDGTYDPTIAATLAGR